MPESLFDRAAATAGRVPSYAVVPFVASLLAFDGGRYFTFALLYALGAVVVSLAVSPVLSTGDVAAIVVVAAVLAFPSLVASAAAMLVVAAVADGRSRPE